MTQDPGRSNNTPKLLRGKVLFVHQQTKCAPCSVISGGGILQSKRMQR